MGTKKQKVYKVMRYNNIIRNEKFQETKKMKNTKQKDVWELIMEKHNIWTTPSYCNHVREVVKLIEEDNPEFNKVPMEVVWKLNKRYQKMRDLEVK